MVDFLFEDIFTLTKLDPDGKKFDQVSRIEARSEQFDMYMQLDVNTEIYPLHLGDKFTMVLAPTLSLNGTPDSGYFSQGDICPVWWPSYDAKGRSFKCSQLLSWTRGCFFS